MTFAVDSDQPPEQVTDGLRGLEASIEQTAITDVENQLGELETAVDRIPSPDPSPQTTLQLQHQADVEGAWQNYLQYFLNPNAHHGLGKDALLQFLQGLDTVGPREFPTRVSDEVVVASEVSSPNDNRPDIVIQDPEEFFVCCELKLYSSEGDDQTERYVEDSYIGSRQKSRFPDHGHHYVYIRRPDRSQASASEFVNVTWQQVRQWFQSLLTNHQGRYPTRTTAQLADFLDTIQQDMTQDDHIQTAQEKMRLYFNHEDAIREARDGLQTAYEYERDNWRRRFVDGYLPENWSPDWHTNPNRYGQIYHSQWRQDEELAIDDADIQMHFVHLIRNSDSFENGTLTFQLRWPGESPYRERFKELFVGERFADELDAQLGEYNINKKVDYNHSNPRFIEKVYSVVKTDLPQSYYEGLQQATREHIAVAPVINELLETAIEEVEGNL